MEISEIKKIAGQRTSTLHYEPGKTTLETLRSIRFEIPTDCDLFTQKEIAEQNIALDQASCLGRVAQSLAIVEKHHPESNIKVGEVVDDYFRSIMLPYLPHESHDDTFMQELLMYEEPHSVLVVDGMQFDPLSTKPGFENIVHPEIRSHSSWESILADMLVSQSHLTDDTKEKTDLLHEAERICPGLLVVAENMAGLLIMFGKIDAAIEIIKKILARHISARGLYSMYLLTGDDQYRDVLFGIYTEKILKHLEHMGKEG